ncbi:atp18 subunit J of the mitochondrial F1F0 ATP synthase [Nothophoma quercina]|uniref:Atp18 subunit J of the mitochondrial F1F0 ATP synthase n=1 Tax=Nothophoma quercina TaxID=749835 RepID=A0ABR3S650_9PLEO
MPLLGRKFPAQIANGRSNAAKPMWPFYVSGLVILYGVNAAANAMGQSEEYKNDPRNPAFKNQSANH